MSATPQHRLTKSSRLVIASDIHVGATEHAESEFDEMLRWVRDEDALILLGGDVADNSIASGKSPGEKLLGQSKWPTEQAKIAFDKFRPFAKKGRLIGIVRGNHEARTRRESLFDLCEFLAHALDVPYLGVGGYLRVITGSQLYTIAVQHGRSGAANPFLENDRLMRLYPAAELISLGHNHHLAARTVPAIGVSPEGTECLKETWQVRSGSYLRYCDYVRELGLTPQKIGSPIVHFDPKQHRISVDTTTLSWGF